MQIIRMSKITWESIPNINAFLEWLTMVWKYGQLYLTLALGELTRAMYPPMKATIVKTLLDNGNNLAAEPTLNRLLKFYVVLMQQLCNSKLSDIRQNVNKKNVTIYLLRILVRVYLKPKSDDIPTMKILQRTLFCTVKWCVWRRKTKQARDVTHLEKWFDDVVLSEAITLRLYLHGIHFRLWRR